MWFFCKKNCRIRLQMLKINVFHRFLMYYNRQIEILSHISNPKSKTKLTQIYHKLNVLIFAPNLP